MYKYLYMRLSLEDKDVATGKVSESASISSQRECLRAFLEKHPELGNDFTEIVDDGCTGTNDNRPGLMRILEQIPSGKVAIIIVRDLSRFFRNYIEAGRYLEFVFPTYNVRFISVNDDFDSERIGESVGGPELAIRNLINHMYSIDTSRKVKSVMDMKKREGKYFAGTAPYGYTKNRESDRLEIDHNVASVVKDIFLWTAEGVSLTRIAQRLNAAHVPTPSAYMASTRGNYRVAPIWNYNTVRNLLKERSYTGDSVPFRSRVEKVGSGRTLGIPPEERLVIANTHEAIISHELYEQANRQLELRRKGDPTKRKQKTGRKAKLPIPMICGRCGAKMVVTGGSYVCQTSIYDKEAVDCAQVKIGLNQALTALAAGISARCAFLKEQLESASRELAELRNRKSAAERSIEDYQRKDESFRLDVISLYERYADGKISKAEFVSGKALISSETEQLKTVISNERNRIEALEETIENIVRFEREQVKTTIDGPDSVTDEVICEYIDHVVVYPQGLLNIEWKKGQDIGCRMR